MADSMSARCDALRGRLRQAIAPFGEMAIIKSGSYDQAGVTFQIFLPFSGDPAQAREALRSQFRMRCGLGSPLEASDFDLPLEVRGLPAQLVGINSRAPSKPFLVRTSDGAQYRCAWSVFLEARAKAQRAAPPPPKPTGKRLFGSLPPRGAPPAPPKPAGRPLFASAPVQAPPPPGAPKPSRLAMALAAKRKSV
jgi:hypothetical protein